jgi:HAD superfamily hydrolase (TIGR01484 family)
MQMTSSLLHHLSPAICQSIRCIATDLDGTLTQAGKFSPELLQALLDLKAAGIQVVIVTGRSAGWVQGLVSYLPIVGAIAENGGLFYANADRPPEILTSHTVGVEYRQQLAQVFHHLQTQFPALQESVDNAFRITDWTFDLKELQPPDLEAMQAMCQRQGWGFTYSTVQAHIKPNDQDKATGLLQVLQRHFPDLSVNQLVTVGDSPNDESLFERDRFPLSVGVANVLHYRDYLHHQPAYVTHAPEVEGFCELAQRLIQQRQS